MDLAGVLALLLPALREAGVEPALIGGLALSAHGAGRATADLDLLVAGESSAAVAGVMQRLGYRTLHAGENAVNYASDDPELGRVDYLLAHRPYARAMIERARLNRILGQEHLLVVDAADLIGLKVQASSNDPSRARLDLADIQRLLAVAPDLDLARVREYFQIFEREEELDALLAATGRRL